MTSEDAGGETPPAKTGDTMPDTTESDGPGTSGPVALETPPLYDLRGVERVYMRGSKAVAALRGLDLRIGSGEFVCLEGPSGSGKSTLLQLLGALDTPTAGSIAMDGHELTEAGDDVLTDIRSRRIGFVFQQFNLIPTLSAAENVALAMAPHHPTREAREARATDLLSRVGLGERLEHLPSSLSGGEQQRVAIARALANEPEVIVADEPTGNLDSESAGEVMSLLVELRDRDGVTVIVATHDPEVARHADRRIKLRDGQVVEDSKS
jgi:putative ABC transport system ATP-binding protein